MLRRVLVGILILVGPLSCYSWQPERLSPEVLAVSPPAGPPRVTTIDGHVIVLARPSFSADTLRDSDPSAVGPVRLAISDIRRMETRQLSSVRSLALMAGAAVMALVIYSYAVLSNPNY